MTRRAGYTLFEIIVVVAIIALITSITLPYVTTSFSDAHFEAAGDMILARMADARSMAMEQGKPFRFGFIPGTGQFQIAADDSSVWQTAGSQGTAIDKVDQLTGTLPQDVRFSAAPSSPSGGSGASGSWQLGGIFLPDGTAHGGLNSDGTTIDDVSFYYGMPGRQPRGVRLRGLTGTVRLFDPTDAEANQP